MVTCWAVVLGRAPYNDSDVLHLEQSDFDSSSDATASCSATCSNSSGDTDNAATGRPRLVQSVPPSTRYGSLLIWHFFSLADPADL